MGQKESVMKKISLFILIVIILASNTLIATAEDKKVQLKEVFIAGYFPLGQYKVTNKIKDQLRRCASLIPAKAHGVVIEGYADKSGQPKSNKKLAVKRADEVEIWLQKLRPDVNVIEKKGIIYDVQQEKQEKQEKQVNSRIARVLIYVPIGTYVDNKTMALAMLENFKKIQLGQKSTQNEQSKTGEAMAQLATEMKEMNKTKEKDYSGSFQHTWKLIKGLAVIILVGMALMIMILRRKTKTVVEPDEKLRDKVEFNVPNHPDKHEMKLVGGSGNRFPNPLFADDKLFSISDIRKSIQSAMKQYYSFIAGEEISKSFKKRNWHIKIKKLLKDGIILTQ